MAFNKAFSQADFHAFLVEAVELSREAKRIMELVHARERVKLLESQLGVK